MTAPDLDVLESLLAKATPGPWKIHARSDTAVDGATGHVVAACGGYHNNTRDPGQLHDELASNAALIVAAVNALPSLIAYVRELERQRDAVAAPAPSAHQTARFDLAWLISAINVHRHLPRPVGPELPKWYAENDRWLREASEMLNKIYSAENTPGSAAQPAAQRAPVRVPCPNKVDGVCPLPNVHCAYPKCTEGTAPLSHVTPAGPPAPRAQAATDDLVARLSVCAPSSVADDAIAELQRQAREIADTRAMLQNTNRDAARLAHLADKYKWQVRDTCTRAERAEAERDALREVVRAADGLRKLAPAPDAVYLYDRARAKWEGK